MVPNDVIMSLILSQASQFDWPCCHYLSPFLSLLFQQSFFNIIIFLITLFSLCRDTLMGREFNLPLYKWLDYIS